MKYNPNQDFQNHRLLMYSSIIPLQIVPRQHANNYYTGMHSIGIIL